MKLIDIIGNEDIEYIAWRAQVYIDEYQYDLFIGATQYKDGKLVSLDGDSYSLNTEISDYLREEDGLTVWIKKL